MPRHVPACALAAALAALAAGCRKPVWFPMDSPPAPAAGAYRAHDTDGDGRPDFFLWTGEDGRIDRAGYDRDGDGTPDETVALDAIPFAACRHLVLVLDGVGYDLVREYYEAGGLRMFHRPSRVVAPYPTLTDLCLEDALGYMPCPAFEARYFDRRANRLAGGPAAYLAGRNEPYNHLLQYRANLIWDAVGYVLPWQVFGKEVNDAKRRLDRRQTQELLAYFVSSAGVGTRMGAPGHRLCLQRVEQLVTQVLWETRGLTKVTLLADHGHTYVPAERIDLERHLEAKGYRLTERLTRPRDVVYVRFGLETYASFGTNEPEALAGDLVACEGVELASYAQGDAVVVLAPDGSRAVIRRRGGRYAYEPAAGDPLKLRDLLARVPADADGYREADALLAATVGHTYPAPLQRLWRAHFAMAEHAPDVIVSLEDRFFSGSKSFGGAVSSIASTHGGLNARNSVTFIMSTAGPLPAFMQSADIPRYMSRLVGERWPLGR